MEENNSKITLDNILSQCDNLSFDDLDTIFDKLKPVPINELNGEWKGGKIKTTKKYWDIIFKDFVIFKWHGKRFFSQNNVKALVWKIFGKKFNIPFFSARLREIKYRDQISTSMIYNYMPIIDHFKKIDSNTLMGIMERKGKKLVYFFLKREQ